MLPVCSITAQVSECDSNQMNSMDIRASGPKVPYSPTGVSCIQLVCLCKPDAKRPVMFAFCQSLCQTKSIELACMDYYVS